MNLTGKSASSAMAPGSADGGSLGSLGNVSQSNLLSWAGTFGQGLTSLTKGKPCWYSLALSPLVNYCQLRSKDYLLSEQNTVLCPRRPVSLTK